MIDWTKPIQTSDGQPAEFLRRLNCGSAFPNVVIYQDAGEEQVGTATDDGKIWENIRVVNVPERINGYVNVYDEKDKITCSKIYPSADAADKGCLLRTATRISRVRIDVQRGQMDE